MEKGKKSAKSIKQKKKNVSKSRVILNNSSSENSNSNTPEKVDEGQKIELDDITEKLTNSTIFYREDEKEKIKAFTSSKDQKILFISGQPGTGKTSLVLDYFKHLKGKSLIYFHINCMSLTSASEFYAHIFKMFNNVNIYEKLKNALNKIHYEKIINYLKDEPNNKNILRLLNGLKGNISVVFILDEVDFLYKKSDEIIFMDILNTPYLTGANLKMILISNNSDFDNEIFPKLKNRKIQLEKIVFHPYSHIDSYNIMKKKLEEINLLDNFSNDSIKFLSTKMSKSGDLRPILEIVKSIILRWKNEFENNSKKIELKDMFDILKQKNININEIFSSLTNEQKIVAVALYYAMKRKGLELDEKAIYNVYKEIKKEAPGTPLTVEEFREVIQSFCDVGLIELKNKKSKSKNSGSNLYRVKHSDEEMEVIFMDTTMYKFFNKE